MKHVMSLAESKKMKKRLLMLIKGYLLWYKGILKFLVLLMMIIGLERISFIPNALHMGGYAW